MESTFYAAYNNDMKIHTKGSSGSVYYLLAKKIIDDGGIVFAAIYDENFNVKHSVIADEDSLFLSMGSKYVASDLSDTFKSVETFLKKDRYVLFIGTPCQCAGLSSYISIKAPNKTELLILIDIVCQGVPSSKVWQSYLCEKDLPAIKSINMRDKTQDGWLNYCLSIEYKNGKKEIQSRSKNIYLKGFVGCYFLRPSCYKCKFKGENRFSDITLGDLWGCNVYAPNLYQYNGTSLVICNSIKGEELLSKINNSISITQINEKATVIKYNHCYVESVAQPEKRNQFFDLLNKEFPYSKIYKIVAHRSLKEKAFDILRLIYRRFKHK